VKTCPMNWESRSLSEALHCSQLKPADWLSVVKEQHGRTVPRRRSMRILDPLSPYIGQTHDETTSVPQGYVHRSTMRMRSPFR
jgi:hypothetical protein